MTPYDTQPIPITPRTEKRYITYEYFSINRQNTNVSSKTFLPTALKY